MNRLAAGILAHVDAGKTTLSEAMLYTTGRIRRLGRVDHRDAFLDTFALERERGITIFSKQAELTVGDLSVTLLDTPGLFVNKMDLPGADRSALLAQLRARLGEGCVDFTLPPDQLQEEAALCDEEALARFLEAGSLTDAAISGLVARRRVFPCFFGSGRRGWTAF